MKLILIRTINQNKIIIVEDILRIKFYPFRQVTYKILLNLIIPHWMIAAVVSPIKPQGSGALMNHLGKNQDSAPQTATKLKERISNTIRNV